MTKIGVVGAGAFGSALAVSLAEAGRNVELWGRGGELLAKEIAAGRLPKLENTAVPDGLVSRSAISDISADTVLVAVPTQNLRQFLETNTAALSDKTLVLCCKGITRDKGLRPSEVARECCGAQNIAVLTGPSFAADIGRRLPTALTLATPSEDQELQRLLTTNTLRIYLTDDVVGAELGGALKNVVAIVAGMTIGAGLGESARSAVITRGFAEMMRFAQSFGANPLTMTGLSGLGDLLLTASSEKSRNYRAGLLLGQEKPLPDDWTIEGVATSHAVNKLARGSGIDMPITGVLTSILDGRTSVLDAANILMSRPLRRE